MWVEQLSLHSTIRNSLNVNKPGKYVVTGIIDSHQLVTDDLPCVWFQIACEILPSSNVATSGVKKVSFNHTVSIQIVI